MKKFSNSNCLYISCLCVLIGPRMTIVSSFTWIQLNNKFATVCSVFFIHIEFFFPLSLEKEKEL